jgi:hypothetical protein
MSNSNPAAPGTSLAPVSEIYPEYSFRDSIAKGTTISTFTVKISPAENKTHWNFRRRRLASRRHRETTNLRDRHKSAVDTFCHTLNKKYLPILEGTAELNRHVATDAKRSRYKHHPGPWAKKSRIWLGDARQAIDDPSTSYVDIDVGDISRRDELLSYFPLPSLSEYRTFSSV